MTPHNNLSVLPFYTSIEQQNARKWWIAGKVYPLFTPMGQLLPFQIQRPNRVDFGPGDIIDTTDYDKGYLTSFGEWLQDNETPAQVAVYDVTGMQRVYIYNLPKAYTPTGPGPVFLTANIVFKANGQFIISVIKNDDYFNGIIDVPEGATDMYVQAYNQQVGEYVVTVHTAVEIVEELSTFEIYRADGKLFADISHLAMDIPIKVLTGYDVVVYNGYELPVEWEIGQFYIKLSDSVDTWFSDVFTVVKDISGYLKLEWWDDADFVMDAGAIVYTEPDYKNVLYLCSEIAKPEYNFTEEIIERDGYTFPVKQVSEKKYRFSFLASEYLLDVLRFVRMSDHVRISKDGQTFVNVDTFLITPDWEAAGDVAVVDAEFTTDTVAKKNGHVYIPE